MRVLIACEYSGTVRRAFRERGHNAWSCDLLPADDESPYHYQCDVLGILGNGWDMMIAHPPCAHLAVSGAAWFHKKQSEQLAALDFVKVLMNADVPHIAIENPVSIIASVIRPADQIIHPWQFGHAEQKTTCLWLKNLPRLVSTHNVYAHMMKLPRNQRERLHYLPPSADRWKLRSVTYSGIAAAMAEQWGRVDLPIQMELFNHESLGGA